MQETLQIGDKPIRLQVHEPAATGKPTPAIVLLHGSGGNVDWWSTRIAPHVTGAGLALFAPHYFDRTGTTRAHYETIMDGVHVPLWIDTLKSVLEVVAARPSIDPARIAVVGVSLGAFLALGFAAECSASDDSTTRCKIRCLVDVSGGLVEPYASRATPHFPPTQILHGAADTIVPVHHATGLDALLSKLGVEHELNILPGEDHWFSEAGQATILLKLANFLGKHLLGS